MGVGALLGFIGTVIGILGGVVAYTRFAAQAPLEAKLAAIEGELALERRRGEEDRAREERRYRELEARYQSLLQDFASLKRGRTGVLLKNEIDLLLQDGMRLLQTGESAVLVPAPPPSRSFVFLAAYGPAAPRLLYSKVPLERGKVGKVFATGRLDNTSDPRRDAEFFGGVDEKAGHTSHTLLTVPLTCDGETVGVVQFLNKEGGRPFTRQDELTAGDLAADLAAKVRAFVADRGNFELLGLSTEEAPTEETIVFCDLTASSSLFRSLPPQDAIDCVNEYFQRQSEVAIGHGATIDKYLGDGIMLRFAGDGGDSARRAVTAGLAMLRDFEALRRSWLDFEMPADDVHNRIGVATGPVFEAVLGHRQHQQITVIGDTVITAANLVEISTRERDVILVDARTRAALDASLAVQQVPDELERRVKTGAGPFFEVATVPLAQV